MALCVWCQDWHRYNDDIEAKKAEGYLDDHPLVALSKRRAAIVQRRAGHNAPPKDGNCYD